MNHSFLFSLMITLTSNNEILTVFPSLIDSRLGAHEDAHDETVYRFIELLWIVL